MSQRCNSNISINNASHIEGEMQKKEIKLDATIWAQTGQNKFLGGDRITLLEKINELGLINSAAKALGLSYKTAWNPVNMVNNLSEQPLVDRVIGGKGGGGTILTKEGKNVIEQFRVVQIEHRRFLKNLRDVWAVLIFINFYGGYQ